MHYYFALLGFTFPDILYSICTQTTQQAPGNPHKWYATRQVDKLNNENFSFPVLYVPGFFMLHFEVSLCDTPLVSGYLSFAEPVC